MKRKPVQMKKKIVLIQGAYEILNWGHIKSFALAKTYGDYLIIALNTNKLVKLYKGRLPVLPWYQKRDILLACKNVDKVIAAPNFSPIELLKKYDVDVYCLTDEWASTKKAELKFMSHKPNGEVQYLPRFKGVVPTSTIKKILFKEAQDGFMK